MQSRMMTIADIYDALVAWDRPYKKSGPGGASPGDPPAGGEGREARPGPPRRVPRGEDLRPAGVQGPAQAEVLRLAAPPLVIAHRGDSAHRPENTLASFAERPRGRSEPRRAGRAAHRGRPRDRHPRPRPRADHHRPRRRPPADAGRGPVGVGGLPGPFRERLRGRAGPRPLRGPRAPARAGEGPRGDQGRVGDGRRRGRHRGAGRRRRSAGRAWRTPWRSSPSTTARSCASRRSPRR